MLPLVSIAIPIGLLPVFPNIVDLPVGVIFVTLFVPESAVYMLPLVSIAIPFGSLPVFPNIVDLPVGVIFVTLSDPELVV